MIVSTRALFVCVLISLSCHTPCNGQKIRKAVLFNGTDSLVIEVDPETQSFFSVLRGDTIYVRIEAVQSNKVITLHRQGWSKFTRLEKDLGDEPFYQRVLYNCGHGTSETVALGFTRDSLKYLPENAHLIERDSLNSQGLIKLGYILQRWACALGGVR